MQKKSLILDVFAYWIHGSGVGLLYVVDRERRRHLREQKESRSFQEGRANYCEWTCFPFDSSHVDWWRQSLEWM